MYVSSSDGQLSSVGLSVGDSFHHTRVNAFPPVLWPFYYAKPSREVCTCGLNGVESTVYRLLFVPHLFYINRSYILNSVPLIMITILSITHTYTHGSLLKNSYFINRNSCDFIRGRSCRFSQKAFKHPICDNVFFYI